MTCVRAQEFLGRAKVTAKTTVDARKSRFSKEEAVKLAREHNEVYAFKGKKVVHLTTKNADDNELLAVLIGPSGNLRAPTLKVGTTLLVGFDEDTYSKFFG